MLEGEQPPSADPNRAAASTCRLSQQEVFTLSEVPLQRPCCQGLVRPRYRLALESKQISVHLPPEPISLRAEPYRLRLILDNLFPTRSLVAPGADRSGSAPGRERAAALAGGGQRGPVIPPDERERHLRAPLNRAA